MDASTKIIANLRYNIFLAITVTASFSAYAKDKPIELKLDQVYRIHGDYQISGAAIMAGAVYFVSDMDRDDSIYFTDFESGKVDVAYDFHKIAEYEPYIKNLRKNNLLKTGFRANDYEGLAFCPEPLTFFIANERARDVLIIKKKDDKLNMTTFTVDDKDAEAGGINAGLEGVAVDCEKKIMYVAKEREPRWIYVYKMEQIADGQKIQPIERFDLPKDSKSKIPPDFADLTFVNGKLYILERSIQQIAVYDPDQKKEIKKYSYASVRDHEFDDNKNGKIDESEKGLFESGEPYGLGEGLVIEGNNAYIFFDNNQKTITDYAAKQYSFEKNSESIVAKFTIPE